MRKLLSFVMALALCGIGGSLFQNGCGVDPYYLYDPYGYGYDAMQDVIDYRSDVMDWSNDAWDAYILE